MTKKKDTTTAPSTTGQQTEPGSRWPMRSSRPTRPSTTLPGRSSSVRTAVVILLAATALATAGCGESRDQTVAKCEIEAHKTYPGMALSNEATDFVLICMRAAGYAYDPNCSFTSPIRARTADCYMGSLEAWWRRNIARK